MSDDLVWTYMSSYMRTSKGELKTDVFLNETPTPILTLESVEASRRVVGAQMVVTRRDTLSGLVTPVESMLSYLQKPRDEWVICTKTTDEPVQTQTSRGLVCIETENEIPVDNLTLGEGLETLVMALDAMKPTRRIVEEIKPNMGYHLMVHPSFFSAIAAFNKAGLGKPIKFDLGEAFAPEG